MMTEMTATLMAINDSLYNSSYDINYPSHNETGIVCYESGECKINHTIRCVGDPAYCNLTEEEYRNLLYDYIFPTIPEWALIISHTIVFFMGLLGNALVCLAVYTNQSMRTVTNIFIVNLAIADFFVILFCLPPTVLWDVTETWFLGNTMCKVVIYFQTVSVTVSILTLTFISIDRWYAICFPLRYKPQPERALLSIGIIWLIGILFDLPEFNALKTEKKDLRFDIDLFTQCTTDWSTRAEKIFYIIKLIFLYTLPLLLMTIAYFKIVRVLWRSDNIPGHREMRVQSTNCYRSTKTHTPHVGQCESSSTTMGQLRARRKAAKMLVAVVFMFAACYFPVHALNIARYSIDDLNQSEVISVMSLISHWLCYANSAINPLIYNFMSGKFRREFRNVLEKGHCLKHSGRQRGRARQSEYRSRNIHDDQEQSFIHSTTHMIHLQPSIKRTYGQPTWQTQTSFNVANGTNGHDSAVFRDSVKSVEDKNVIVK